MKNPASQIRQGQCELIGKRLLLRGVRLTDAEGPYLQWMNDPEVVKFTESRFLCYSKGYLKKYVATINKNPDFIFYAITLTDSGRHVGNIKLGPIDWNHRFGDVGIIIGAKNCWGHGYAEESIRLLADHAFASLKLHKLTASCYEINFAAIKAFEKAGFMHEGLRRSQYLSDGQYVDLVCLALLNPGNLVYRR